MRPLTFDEVLLIYYRIMRDTGGAAGVLNESAIKSALSQPKMTFDGVELYSTLSEKAAAVGHALIANHPFIDGNKRIGQAVMEGLLLRNGFEIDAALEVQEEAILKVAQGEMQRRELAEWVQMHIKPRR